MKWLSRAMVALVLLVFVVAITLMLTARSEWFARRILTEIVQQLERATGGKAELSGFRFDPKTWQVAVDGLTLHGTEGPGEPPLLHVKTASVGWKIISLIDRKLNLVSIDVDGPEVSLRRDAQGRWNLPSTGRKSAVTPFDRFIDVKAGRVRVTNGMVRFNDQKIPLAFEASDAEVTLGLAADEAYTGTVKTSRVHMTRPFFTPIDAGLESDVRMDHTGLAFSKTRIAFGESSVNASGRVLNWAEPHLEASAEGDVRLADVKRQLRLPMEPKGRAKFKSTWVIGADSSVNGSGTLSAADLDWAVAGVRVAPFNVDADWRVTRRGAEIDRATVGLLGGTFSGKGKITEWRDFAIDGTLADLALSRLYSLQDNREFPWSGTVSGPISIAGAFPDVSSAMSDLTIARGETKIPVEGRLTFNYDVPTRTLVFSPSHLALNHSRAEFDGDANRRLRVSASTSDLSELLPAIRFYAGRDLRVPVTLDGSQVKVDGIFSNRNEFEGTLDVGRFALRDTAYSGTFDSFRAAIFSTPAELRVNRFRLEQQGAVAQGTIRTAWQNGNLRDSDAIAGDVQVTGVDVARVIRESGTNALPADAKLGGVLSGSAQIAGTVGAPAVSGNANIVNGSAWDQAINRARATFRASRTQVELLSAEITSGRATANLQGDYSPSPSDWRTGRARFNVNGGDASVRRWTASLPDGLDAELRGDAKGEIAFSAGTPSLVSLEGTVTIPQLTLNGRPLGDAKIETSSQGRIMTARLTARMLGSQVRGSAEWSLTGNNPGLGQTQITGLTIDNLRTLGIFGDPDRPLGARGSLDAELGFTGPVLRPDLWTSTVKITRLALEPRPTDATIDTTRFAVRNESPLTGIIDRRGLTIESARLVGEGTDLSISGSLGLRSRAPWNLALRGSFNLTGLSVLEPDIEATGISTVDATVRGELYKPAINGSMQVSDATFRARNVPNGLEQVTGTIRFDTNRATIEKLTAQTGGGNLAVTGFVGFGGPQLVYRLQGDARHVRVRYPDEVSTTFDGKLSMSGTSAQSLLSGDVTVQRVGLQAQADLGSLLAQTARSALSTPTQNAFLRGMQLDVHIVTAPDAELQTSLTRDLQPQADIRVRGTAARPVALGRMTLSEGELSFFGTRYRVNRGEVNLFNPARIEPVLNFDLETQVRGVTVNITLSGPVDKLNTSYRSDPPLQANEIVALLTVGRGPASSTTATTQATTVSPTSQYTSGGGSLLGGAISAPVSGRLQRLFGVATPRINIDPDLNANSPQARLTIEQQLSREIRITYITTLNRTQNQIVRFQWDISQDYSLIFVRDENGLFGTDFLFRKRFK